MELQPCQAQSQLVGLHKGELHSLGLHQQKTSMRPNPMAFAVELANAMALAPLIRTLLVSDLAL